MLYGLVESGGFEGGGKCAPDLRALSRDRDGGQIGLGLFASITVEPRGSRWYRSQVTLEELHMGAQPFAADRHDYNIIDYRADHPTRQCCSSPLIGCC